MPSKRPEGREPCKGRPHSTAGVSRGNASNRAGLGPQRRFDRAVCVRCGHDLERRSATADQPPGPWYLA